MIDNFYDEIALTIRLAIDVLRFAMQLADFVRRGKSKKAE